MSQNRAISLLGCTDHLPPSADSDPETPAGIRDKSSGLGRESQQYFARRPHPAQLPTLGWQSLAWQPCFHSPIPSATSSGLPPQARRPEVCAHIACTRSGVQPGHPSSSRPVSSMMGRSILPTSLPPEASPDAPLLRLGHILFSKEALESERTGLNPGLLFHSCGHRGQVVRPFESSVSSCGKWE